MAPVHPSIDSSVCFTGKFEEDSIVLLDALAYFVRVDCHHVLQVLQHFRMFPVPRRRPDKSRECFYPVEMPCEPRNCIPTFRVAIELEYLPLRCQRPELDYRWLDGLQYLRQALRFAPTVLLDVGNCTFDRYVCLLAVFPRWRVAYHADLRHLQDCDGLWHFYDVGVSGFNQCIKEVRFPLGLVLTLPV